LRLFDNDRKILSAGSNLVRVWQFDKSTAPDLYCSMETDFNVESAYVNKYGASHYYVLQTASNAF